MLGSFGRSALHCPLLGHGDLAHEDLEILNRALLVARVVGNRYQGS